MLKPIKLRDLRVGMFLVMHGQGTDTSPLVVVNKHVESEQELAKLRSLDIRDICIDDSLTEGGEPTPAPAAAGDAPAHPCQDPGTEAPKVPLAEELPVAEKLYTDALSHARLFMDDVRQGKAIDYREATPLVDNFIESVFRNDAAAATLFKLKRFDEYSYTHSINVAVLSIILGKYMGLDTGTLRLLGIAGLFHDVGKARIPEDILNKPGKLTQQEFRIIKTHVLESYKIMSEQKGLEPDVLRGILEHHERYDGSGYPRGISGDAIGAFGRIISVVDVYDALTSKRAYKDAIPAASALRVMYDWRDTTFPPRSIENFIKCIGVYPVGSFVRLSSGEYAVVARNNAKHSSRPLVKVVFDSKLRHKEPVMLDLALANGKGSGMEIAECLNPAQYRVDVGNLLVA